MPYCPKCKSEYRNDFKTCPQCEVDLVEALKEELKQKKLVAMKPKKLYSTTNQLEESILQEYLKENNIPVFKKGHGTGDYMNLYMGYSIYGEDLYVDEADYEKAKEILTIFQAEQIDEEPDKEGEYGNQEEPDPIPFYRNRVIVARIILAVLLGSFVLIEVLNNF